MIEFDGDVKFESAKDFEDYGEDLRFSDHRIRFAGDIKVTLPEFAHSASRYRRLISSVDLGD